MERENAFEEIGYKPVPTQPRPLMDAGEMDYLTIGKPRMSRAEGIALWRKQLNEMEERARTTSGSDTDCDQQDQTAA